MDNTFSIFDEYRNSKYKFGTDTERVDRIDECTTSWVSKKKIQYQFLHNCLPSCRCHLLIILPVHLNTETDMKEIMKSALVNCIGFELLKNAMHIVSIL